MTRRRRRLPVAAQRLAPDAPGRPTLRDAWREPARWLLYRTAVRVARRSYGEPDHALLWHAAR